MNMIGTEKVIDCVGSNEIFVGLIDTRVFLAMSEWCVKNISHFYYPERLRNAGSNGGVYKFWFTNHTDAVLFKLVWL